MKTKYLFCHEAGPLTVDSLFVTVYFGQSQRDKAILSKCQSLRFRRDTFFEPYTSEVAVFLDRVACSLFPGVTLPLLRLNHSVMSATEFQLFVRQALLDHKQQPSGTFANLQHLDVHFYANTHRL